MTLNAGTKLGPYEIVAPLGAGGMGEVYRARDTKLNRDVALKVLPEAFAKDAARMARFQREAEMLASLNHPNIASIYGLEESGGVRALVMELVEGPTLAERITGTQSLGRSRVTGPPSPLGRGPRGEGSRPSPLPLDESLHIAKQIAEALEYAHERGIVHRDVKPANIKITGENQVKILDFGLAKALDPQTPASGVGAIQESRLEDLATVSLTATPERTILGTTAYMSPEQARGKVADRRVDIWAFGVVLYEMLTGKLLFGDETFSDTLAAVITKEPDWAALPASTPPPIPQLLRRCLTKDPKQRLQAIGEARITIEETLRGGTGVPAVAAYRQGAHATWRQALPWALAVLLLLTAIASSVSYWRLARVPARTIIAEIGPPQKARFSFFGYVGSGLIISPDGRTLAFPATDATGKTMLWVRSLDSPAARLLPGTEGENDPFWSADSRAIAFFAEGKLKTIEASGGAAVVVADAPREGGGGWNRDGTILFVPDNSKGIYQVSASGGTPSPVITLDASRFSYYALPRFLPDGKHFLYVARSPDPELDGIYFASLDGKERRQLLRGGTGAVYASGFLLYVRGNTLMAQPFDAGELKGGPHPVTEHVATVYGRSLFDVSENGILVYQTDPTSMKCLTWFDRTGKNLGAVGELADYYDVRLSPSGDKLAFNASYPAGSPNSEIWVDELARGVSMRLTIDPDTDHGIPIWSPDGSTILFGALSGKARRGIYRKASNGGGGEELLLPSESSDTSIWPTSWSRDGRFILYARGWLDQADIWVLPLAGDRKPRLFVRAPVAAYDGQFSPNARWVAYTSKESGREEVYIVPFDAARVLSTSTGLAGASGGGKWQISASGGFCPRWRGDGKEIFYLSPDNQLMAAEVEERDRGIGVRTAQALFRVTSPPSVAAYDVTPDGNKFVMNTLSEQNTPLTLVLNWTANLMKQ